MNLNSRKLPLFIFQISALLFFNSCKHEAPNLVGSWTGPPSTGCPYSGFAKGESEVNYKFLEDGTCESNVIGNDGQSDNVVMTGPVNQYEIVNDSLILTNNDNKEFRRAYKIEIHNRNEISLITEVIHPLNTVEKCTSVTKLKRVSS